MNSLTRGLVSFGFFVGAVASFYEAYQAGKTIVPSVVEQDFYSFYEKYTDSDTEMARTHMGRMASAGTISGLIGFLMIPRKRR